MSIRSLFALHHWIRGHSIDGISAKLQQYPSSDEPVDSENPYLSVLSRADCCRAATMVKCEWLKTRLSKKLVERQRETRRKISASANTLDRIVQLYRLYPQVASHFSVNQKRIGDLKSREAIPSDLLKEAVKASQESEKLVKGTADLMEVEFYGYVFEEYGSLEKIVETLGLNESEKRKLECKITAIWHQQRNPPSSR